MVVIVVEFPIFFSIFGCRFFPLIASLLFIVHCCDCVCFFFSFFFLIFCLFVPSFCVLGIEKIFRFSRNPKLPEIPRLCFCFPLFFFVVVVVVAAAAGWLVLVFLFILFILSFLIVLFFCLLFEIALFFSLHLILTCLFSFILFLLFFSFFLFLFALSLLFPLSFFCLFARLLVLLAPKPTVYDVVEFWQQEETESLVTNAKGYTANAMFKGFWDAFVFSLFFCFLFASSWLVGWFGWLIVCLFLFFVFLLLFVCFLVG